MTARPQILATVFILLVSCVGAWAETLSTPQYRLKIHPDAKIIQRVDTGWEVVLTVELAGERARVRWRTDGFTAIFPNATMRAQLNPNSTASNYELTTDFEGKRYKIARTAREISWLLPGQEVFFRTFGGKVSNAVGSSDFLNITRDTKGGRISLQSQAGTSDILLKKGALEVFDGPDLLEHVYFVRGLAFQRGPLTLEVPLPEEPFLNALPTDRYLLIPSQQSPLPPDLTTSNDVPDAGLEPLGGPTEAVPSERGPLEAPPSSWDSPVYRAQQGEHRGDPLNARREVRHPSKDRPLDAKTAPNSEEILRVQNY